jgi:hypothetical protein
VKHQVPCRRALLLALTCALFLSPLSAIAQITEATLRGHVLDANGNSIPGSVVTAENEEKGLARRSDEHHPEQHG